MKIPLIAKHVAISLLAVGTVMLLSWWVIDHLAADYFMGLMKEYHIDPKILHEKFLQTTHQYLFLSMALGLVVAGVLSFYITKKVMRSLTEMIAITQRLAKGDYSKRVKIATHDEVGELGVAFNRMVESLEKIEAMRKDLVANVAHELRTPLNNIQGELEAIQDKLLPPSRETINSLHEEVLRLVRLVEALHRLTQMDAALLKLNKEKIDLQGALTKTLQKEKVRFDQKGIRLKLNTQPVWVWADADQITQLFLNLIENILQYTPEKGEAAIEMFLQEPGVTLVFKNSGEGVRPEDLPHLFERFYRGEKSRSRDSGGAGIGLSIVKQIVEAHGGAVEAKGTPQETEIFITLPIIHRLQKTPGL